MLSNKETNAMAVQHTPPPRLSPAGQIEDEADQEDNQLPKSTINNQADDRQKAVPSRRVATPFASSYHHMASVLLRLSQFWKNGPGSHKWTLDFPSTTSTRTKTDSTRYLQPSRNRAYMPKYPTAYGIHQHKTSVSLSDSTHCMLYWFQRAPTSQIVHWTQTRRQKAFPTSARDA
jgi:hypothetical protein